MRKLALILFSALSLASSSAFAASYQQIDGTIVEPILCRSLYETSFACTDIGTEVVSNYSGPDLAPGVSAVGADVSASSLIDADLASANLSGGILFAADLTGANLTGADLTNTDLNETKFVGANLANADLSYSQWFDADVTGMDLSGAILANANGLNGLTGFAFYDINTDFTGATLDGFTPFDPIAAGWTLVPEPSTALLMGLGLAGLAAGLEKRCGA